MLSFRVKLCIYMPAYWQMHDVVVPAKLAHVTVLHAGLFVREISSYF